MEFSKKLVVNAGVVGEVGQVCYLGDVLDSSWFAEKRELSFTRVSTVWKVEREIGFADD